MTKKQWEDFAIKTIKNQDGRILWGIQRHKFLNSAIWRLLGQGRISVVGGDHLVTEYRINEM